MIGYVFGLLSGACFALMAVLIKKFTDKDNVYQALFVAKTFTGLIQLLLLLILFLMDFNLSFPLFGFLLFAGAGLTSELVGSICYFNSIIQIGPSRASSIKASENVVIIFLAALLIQEYLRWQEIMGILMIVGGIIIVVQDTGGEYVSRVDGKVDAKKGILFAFITACAFAVANTMRRSGYSYIPHPLVGNAVNAIAAATGFFLFFLLTGRMKTIQKIEWTLFKCFIGIGITFTLAMLFLNISIYYIAAPLAAVLKNTQPILTIFLSFFLIGKEEKITLKLLLGATGTVLGIVFIFLF